MKNKFVSYLRQLKFDPNLYRAFHAKFITNIRLVILLIISIIVLGAFSFLQIPRRVNPELKIPIVIVSTVLPGAAPSDVETLLTIPLEDKLKNLDGLDTITSTSMDGVSTIVMQFLSTVNVDKAKDDAQSAVDTVSDLPTDALDPNVMTLDFEDQPVWTFALTTDQDEASLLKFSQRLKDYLENISVVDRVTTSGLEKQVVEISFSPTKLQEYNVNPLLLSQLVSTGLKSYPAGNLKTDLLTYSFTIDKEIVSVEDIRNLLINVNGQHIKLSDLALVSLRPQADQAETFFANSEQPSTKTVQFFVYKASTENIDAASKVISQSTKEFLASQDSKFRVKTVLNTGEEIDKQFTDLFGEFRSTILLVFLNLLLFLGLRQAVISSVTVPLTFLSAFFIINTLGMSLNFLTMFAFLLSLGLLIDDTIVTVAAMTRYYATGKFTPVQTGLLVWRDFIIPLWSTTITTIWAFVPLLIASGIIGEFIKPIPIVVTATLLSSTSIAVLITLPLMMIALKPQFPKRVSVLLKVLGVLFCLALLYIVFPKNLILIPLYVVFTLLLFVAYSQRRFFTARFLTLISKNKKTKRIYLKAWYIVGHGLINIETLSVRYMSLINGILSSKESRRKTLFALIIFSVIAYLLIPLGLVKNEFFPKNDQKIIYVNADFPTGTNLVYTTARLKEVMSDLRMAEGAEFLLGEAGTRLDSQGGRSNASGSFLITFHLYPKEERQISSIDLAEKLREKFKDYPGGTFYVQELTGGPPAGADLQIHLLGDDLGQLDTYADKVVSYLKSQKGVANTEKSLRPGTGKVVFIPDKEKLTQNGLTIDAVALWMRTFATGFDLKSLKIDGEDTDIVLKIDSDLAPEELGTLMIPTQNGNLPLLSLGFLKLEASPTLITRDGGKRVISVSASVTKGFSVSEKNQALLKFAQTLNLPKGYSWKTGGVNEENENSVQSIFRAMGLSFLLILVTMVIEFKSYRQALMIMLLIPLAISGVFYVFALTGTPLSFPALIGVLALFGLVVTNGIVVIEKINDNREAGMKLKEAIVDASGSRLEPILLTSITSILGLIPITIADPLWRGLGGAIIAGLLFSGAVKLFFVPVIYYMWYQKDE